MEKKIIKTDQAPQAIGPYSQAVHSGDTLFISGQVAINPETGKIRASDAPEQTHMVIGHLRTILNAAGMGLEDVVKTTIFLTSLDDFAAVNEVYREYFESDPPARATVEVSRLPLGALVEIEAIARK
jgi:2-iminobutanoate/2-iminopropanoate deaminase